jgi:hypothetical protein
MQWFVEGPPAEPLGAVRGGARFRVALRRCRVPPTPESWPQWCRRGGSRYRLLQFGAGAADPIPAFTRAGWHRHSGRHGRADPGAGAASRGQQHPPARELTDGSQAAAHAGLGAVPALLQLGGGHLAGRHVPRLQLQQVQDGAVCCLAAGGVGGG